MKLLNLIAILLLSSLIYGQSWVEYTSSDTPVLSGIVNSIAVDQQNKIWVGTTNGLGVYNGTAWTSYTSSNSGLPNDGVNNIVIDRQGDKWIGTYAGGLARFDGTNWTVYNKSNSGLPNNEIMSIAIDSLDNKWIGTEEGLAKFDGQKWTIFNTFNSGLVRKFISSMTVDAQGYKWIGTYDGLFKFDGQNWTVYNTANSSLPNNAVYSVALDPLGNKWIGTADGLAKFDGQKWTVYNNTLAFVWVTGIVIDQQWNVWITSNGGGISRFDGQNMRSFVPSNSNIPWSSFMSIAIDKHGTKWLGYFGLLAFNGEIETSPSGLKEDGSNLPEVYSLMQNYPNPFNPSTTINYSIPEGRVVTIKVYDMLGKEVAILLNEYKEAGTHSVEFNAPYLPSGIYIYTIQAGEFRESRKLMLLK